MLERTEKERIHVDIVKQHIWDNLDFIYHIEWGFEHRIPEEDSKSLEGFSVEYDLTARHIRFTPDFFVVYRKPKIVCLLEYKTSQTPIYSNYRINQISRLAGYPLTYEDIGQWQTAAHDNYASLQDIKAKVAILYHIAYHDRLLLCDYVDSATEIFRDKVRSDTETGSRTPYLNFDVKTMRTLDDFLIQEYGIPEDIIRPLFKSCCNELRQKLPIEHHSKSSLA